MLTAADIKRLRNLQDKSVRDAEGLFVAEGRRAIDELRSAGLEPVEFYSIGNGSITDKQLERISSLKTPQGSFAVFNKPCTSYSAPVKGELSIALDDIQDPGNLGTIIRTCDWFGIRNIYASHRTADCFSSKVVQATMGAVARVRVYYTDLVGLLKTTEVPSYGTFLMDSSNIYDDSMFAGVSESGAVIVLGNEGNGISNEVEAEIGHRLYIPSFADSHVESLNVSIAAAIAISEFRRRN